MEPKNTSEQTGEQTDGCQVGGIGGLGIKGGGSKSADRELQSGPGDGESSTGTLVHDAVVTVHGARWVPDLTGGELRRSYLCLTTMLLFTWN